jgi:hypothetical protein
MLACVVAGCGGFSQEPPSADEATAARLTAAAARPEPFRIFSPTSFWNREQASTAPRDPSSAKAIRAFRRVIEREKETGTDPTINTSKWSVPVYTVPADQPTIRVTHDNPNTGQTLQAAWDAVPLPPDAHPAAGTDEHLVVWQPSTDKLWEFWHLALGGHGWHAGWGGAMEHVSSNPGVYGPKAWPGANQAWGASASSLSIAGGLITLEDLEDGMINHALAIAIPDVRAGVYASPAHRTDGTSANPLALPEGAHLRLNPNLHLARLHLPPLTLKIARAAQRYGLLVRSRADHVVLYGQDPTPTGEDPYSGPDGYFEGQLPSRLLARFPWGHLQLLRMRLHGYR